MEPQPLSRPQKTWLIAFLYLLQGVNNTVTATIVLTYPTLPSYGILSIFELCILPYSFKFLMAPIQQRYTSNTYGRRKTWIVGCLIDMCIFAFIVSRITHQKYMLLVAFVSIPQVLMGTLQDVALDALALKEVQEPDKMSLVQMVFLNIGNVFGGFMFIKFTSEDFGKMIGLSGRIMEVSSFYLAFGAVLLVIIAYMHFLYDEPVLQSELEGENEEKESILETMKRYKTFIDPDRREFRLAVYFLLISLGINFFAKSYLIQLMKQGFSKQRLNEISTGCLLIVMTIFYFSGKINSKKAWTTLKRIMYFKLCVCIFAFLYRSKAYWFIIIYILINDIVISLKMFLECVIINSFPLNKYSAMTIAMANSTRNLGISAVLPLWVVGHLGFGPASIMGFVIQGMVFVCFDKFVGWIKEGEVDEGVILDGDEEEIERQREKEIERDRNRERDKIQGE